MHFRHVPSNPLWPQSWSFLRKQRASKSERVQKEMEAALERKQTQPITFYRLLRALEKKQTQLNYVKFNFSTEPVAACVGGGPEVLSSGRRLSLDLAGVKGNALLFSAGHVKLYSHTSPLLHSGGRGDGWINIIGWSMQLN